MAILSTLWNAGKITGCYLKGVVEITLNPTKPPKTDIHPRMPAYPFTIGEKIRMFPYRHYWKFVPFVRTWMLGWVVVACIYMNFSPTTIATHQAVLDGIHHSESSIVYGRKQRTEDAKYFKENDPMAELRPEWFKKKISVDALNYYPKGYSSGH